MRDLANQSYGQKGAKIDSKFLRRIVVLTFGVIAILLIGRLFFSAGSVISGQSVILRDAPTGLEPVEADSDTSVSAQGVILTSQTARLVNVAEGGGSGTA